MLKTCENQTFPDKGGSVHIFTKQKINNIVGLAYFLRDMNNTKWCNGFYIEYRQSFAKETFSYDEYLKSQNIQY